MWNQVLYFVLNHMMEELVESEVFEVVAPASSDRVERWFPRYGMMIWRLIPSRPGSIHSLPRRLMSGTVWSVAHLYLDLSALRCSYHLP